MYRPARLTPNKKSKELSLWQTAIKRKAARTFIPDGSQECRRIGIEVRKSGFLRGA